MSKEEKMKELMVIIACHCVMVCYMSVYSGIIRNYARLRR